MTGVQPRPLRPARVTFSSIDDVVPVRVRGEGGKFPVLPRDDGFVGRFLQWTIDAKVDRFSLGGYSGPGDHLGFYRREDLPRIKAWLRENGARENDRKTWSRRG